MRKLLVPLLAVTLVAAGLGVAVARERFTDSSIRGRYTGNVDISERIPIDTNATLDIEGRQLLALTFDGKAGVTGITSVTALIPGNPPTTFTCVFDAVGTYQIGESGLGTATLAITPTTECAGPAIFKMSLLVGGRNGSRIDVTVDGAQSGAAPNDMQIPIVGSGVLLEQ